MPGIDGEVDVAIIGAGAAGIAAARHLLGRSRLSVLVLEAGSRIGGRAHTVRVPGTEIPIDLGCAWLHGARTNAWTRIAGEHGFEVDRMPAPWNRDDDMLRLTPDEHQRYSEAADAFYERVSARHDAGPDCAMGDLIEPTDRWHPLLDAISTYVSGAELDRVSCRDHDEYQPGDGPDWRVVAGYGTLISAYGADLPVVLDAAATSIDHTDRRVVRVDTERGRVCAKAVVVTASTSVLAAELIRFRPALPDKIAAAAKLPLGVANKIYLGLDGVDIIAPETYKIGSILTARTGAYHLRPFGRPVIECFYGGELARDLEAGGEAAFADHATGELVELFGSGIKAHLSPIRSTAWAGAPYIGGSYSYAVPGASDCRAVLARAVDDRLFFAGEACSPHKNTTAHGAYESGIAAAQAVLAALVPASAATTTGP